MTKKILLKISTAVLITMLLISLSVLTSCKCRTCNDEESSVPLEILEKADSFITATTGKEFFQKNIKVDFYRTRVTPPYYEMAYKLFMPDKPYVNATIKFTVDSAGNVMKNRDIVGIPRCKNFPEECNFNIDEETARLIASEMGLKEGVREWDAGFLWDFKHQRYVWKVLSTLKELGSEESYRASGQEMVIDPTNGDLLEINDWNIN